jgi:hypothetical protein
MDISAIRLQIPPQSSAFSKAGDSLEWYRESICCYNPVKIFIYHVWDGLCNLTFRVTNFFHWMFGSLMRGCCSIVPYENMTYGSYNQGNVFGRGVFGAAPGRIACTHIAAQAVNHYVNRGHPEDGGAINAIVMEGTVKAMRSAGADLPVNHSYQGNHRVAHKELQKLIHNVPGCLGDLPRFATADETGGFHPEMEDLFLRQGNAPLTYLNRQSHSFSKGDFVTALQQLAASTGRNRAAAVLTSGGASHMVGVTKGADGRVIEAIYFDSHGTARSYNVAFALRWRIDPLDALATFLSEKYGSSSRTLNFTPFQSAGG